MWPFKKNHAPPAVPVVRVQDEQIAWLKAAFPLGQQFNYLGRDMMPTKHSDLREECDGYSVWWDSFPRLHADYCDDTGVIHHITFSYAEAVAIKPAQLAGPG